MYYLTAFVIYTLCCLFLFSSVCYHPHDFLLYTSPICHCTHTCLLYWCLCTVPFIYVSTQSPPMCTWPSSHPLVLFTAIHLCLTSMPDPPSTPFPYYMLAAHLLSCACTLSLSPTRFRSQLYIIYHNTCTQCKLSAIWSADCAGPRTAER